ncbi:MAG: D-alanyl-D-alanine carboxypeptidase [Lachnospiraceae bacterium]|nr:D-alanyl-D-alanine carboxypeptidase [Lachnospiraceae bacterium]
MKKKCMVYLLCFLYLISSLVPHSVYAENKEEDTENIEITNIKSTTTPPDIFAESAIVMDLKTGAILYEKDATSLRYPASITKIMTCLVAIEQIENFDDSLTVSEGAVAAIPEDGSNIGLLPGEVLNLEDCLYAILLASANEAANAMAEYVAGDIESFVALMNQKAEELGTVNTHFENPHGLHDDNHYICAYDMALIAKAAYENEHLRKIITTPYYTIPATNLTLEERPMYNHHKMMFNTSEFFYSKALGGKTGSTEMAQKTLVTYAKVDDKEFVSVVLKSNSDEVYNDTRKILEYSFSEYDYVSPNIDLSYITQISESEDILLKNYGKIFNPDVFHFEYNSNVSLLFPNSIPVSSLKQEIVVSNSSTIGEGTLILRYEDKVVGAYPITYDNYHPVVEPSFIERSTAAIKKIDVRYFILAGAIVLLILLIIVYYIYRNGVHNTIFLRRKRRYSHSKHNNLHW